MLSFDKLVESLMTKGLVNTMSKPLKIKKICDKCGYVMPLYKGKYPKCPLCGSTVIEPSLKKYTEKSL